MNEALARENLTLQVLCQYLVLSKTVTAKSITGVETAPVQSGTPILQSPKHG